MNENSHGYDERLDEKLDTYKLDLSEKDGIEINVMSYNNGVPKLQLTRYYFQKEGIRYRKIGRISLLELEKIYSIGKELLRTHSDRK